MYFNGFIIQEYKEGSYKGVDGEWIESLKNGGIKKQYTNSRQEIIEGFILYYKDFEPEDEW